MQTLTHRQARTACAGGPPARAVREAPAQGFDAGAHARYGHSFSETAVTPEDAAPAPREAEAPAEAPLQRKGADRAGSAPAGGATPTPPPPPLSGGGTPPPPEGPGPGLGHRLGDYDIYPPGKTPEEMASHASEALIQAKSENRAGVQAENRTGLPDALRAGVEGLSGLSLDDVRTHYNSDKPASVGALAYAQGSEIHVGPGQERHLPHEAWHVVQQKQGRVAATVQMKGVGVNDDAGLEAEADAMGARVTAMEVGNAAGLLSATQPERPDCYTGAMVPDGGEGYTLPTVRQHILVDNAKQPEKKEEVERIKGIIEAADIRKNISDFDAEDEIGMARAESGIEQSDGKSEITKADKEEQKRIIEKRIKDQLLAKIDSATMYTHREPRAGIPVLLTEVQPDKKKSGHGRANHHVLGGQDRSNSVFSKATQEKLPVGDGQHRRHVIGRHTLGQACQRSKNDEGLDGFLLSHKLVLDENRLKKMSAKDKEAMAYRLLQDHPGNLWVGDGKENTTIGFLTGNLYDLLKKQYELAADKGGLYVNDRMLGDGIVKLIDGSMFKSAARERITLIIDFIHAEGAEFRKNIEKQALNEGIENSLKDQVEVDGSHSGPSEAESVDSEDEELAKAIALSMESGQASYSNTQKAEMTDKQLLDNGFIPGENIFGFIEDVAKNCELDLDFGKNNPDANHQALLLMNQFKRSDKIFTDGTADAFLELDISATEGETEGDPAGDDSDTPDSGIPGHGDQVPSSPIAAAQGGKSEKGSTGSNDKTGKKRVREEDDDGDDRPSKKKYD